MDLVAHCGWSGAGQFLYTLSMVDVATGWVACAGLRDKRSETVFCALQRLQHDLPFPILGLDARVLGEFVKRCRIAAALAVAGSPRRAGCPIEQSDPSSRSKVTVPIVLLAG